MGLLPEALRLRADGGHPSAPGQCVRAAIRSTNRAELLIRLGRGEAEHLLNEVEAGVAKGIDAYVGRARRVKVLRTLRAAVETRYADAIRLGSDVGPGSGTTPDATSLLASALVDHARARMGHALRREPIAVPSSVSLSTAREIRYWRVATRLASGDTARALDELELLPALPRAPMSWSGVWRPLGEWPPADPRVRITRATSPNARGRPGNVSRRRGKQRSRFTAPDRI